MSLEESIQTYQELRKASTWNQCWFPIFASGGGDFYAMNLASEGQGQIIGFYVFEEEGHLDMDYRKHAEIAHELNPDLKIWLEFLKET